MKNSGLDSGHKKGLVFNIQRFSIHDGPGIRTLIFLKGCNLRCEWCSNPEGQEYEVQVLFNKRKCTLCGECVKCCPENANRIENGEIIYNRELCRSCGKCVSACLSGARSLSGKWMSISEIIDIVFEDEVFIRHSGGGVTLSGGEPTYQYDFVSELLEHLKRNNIHTAIETCGYIKWEKLKTLLNKIDLILFDLKHIDDKKHEAFTGVSNKLIIDNLKRLIKAKEDITVRVTLVPGFNDSKIEKENIEGFIRSLGKEVRIEYLKYHEMGKLKYDLLGRPYGFNKNEREISVK